MAYFKLIVNNTEIELAKNSKFAFSKENQIWQFDRILLERSQSIKIKKTKKNMEIFGLSDRVDFSGFEMRQVYDAQLWYSGGAISGNLHIVDFSGGYFNCIFVFGKNLTLKQIKEAGKIKDIINVENDNFIWNENTSLRTGAAFTDRLELRAYEIDNIGNFDARGTNWNYMPSVNFIYLLMASKDALNFNINFAGTMSIMGYVGIKLNGMNSANIPLAEQSNITFSGGVPLGVNTAFAFSYKGDLTSESGVYGRNKSFALSLDSDAPKFFEAKKDFILRIKFRQNYNFDSETIDKGIYIFRDSEFILRIADRYPFGTSVSMKVLKGDWIVFGERYKYFIGNTGNSTVRAKAYENPDFEYLYFDYLGEEGKISYPDVYQLQPNLPDVTVLDLLKITANLTNTSLYYDKEANTIRFFGYDFSNHDDKIIDLKGKVISENQMKRSVLDYAQNNYIDFASSDKVLESSKLRNNIPILNQNLEREKTIYTIPFSEGNIGSYDNTTENYRLKISDIEVKVDENGNKTYEFGKDKDTIFMTSGIAGGSTQQVKFGQASKLPEIFQNSTSTELTIKQRLFEFMQMNEFSTFLYKNKRWSWSDAQWEDNKTKLSLIKIPDTFKLLGYLAEISKQQIIISNNDYSSAVADLRLSYNDLEIFPVYDDAVDSIDGMAGRNLILSSNQYVNSSAYLLKRYSMPKDIELNTLYFAQIKGSINEGQTFRIFTYNGWGDSIELFVDSSGIFKGQGMVVAEIEDKDPKNISLFNFPSATATSAEVEWIKLSKKENDIEGWTPAPEDSVYISDKSPNVTATIDNGQLKVTNMSGSEGWVDVTFEYYKFTETKRILISKN